jgi:hypothetical protein
MAIERQSAQAKPSKGANTGPASNPGQSRTPRDEGRASRSPPGMAAQGEGNQITLAMLQEQDAKTRLIHEALLEA